MKNPFSFPVVLMRIRVKGIAFHFFIIIFLTFSNQCGLALKGANVIFHGPSSYSASHLHTVLLVGIYSVEGCVKRTVKQDVAKHL